MEIDRDYELFDALMSFIESYPLPEQDSVWASQNVDLLMKALDRLGDDWISDNMLERRDETSRGLPTICCAIHRTISGVHGWKEVREIEFKHKLKDLNEILENTAISAEDRSYVYLEFLDDFEEVSSTYALSPENIILDTYFQKRNFLEGEFSKIHSDTSDLLLSNEDMEIIDRNIKIIRENMMAAFSYQKITELYIACNRIDSSFQMSKFESIAKYLKNAARFYSKLKTPRQHR